MSARLRIAHSVVHRHAAPVGPSYHEARLTPSTAPGQVALRTRLDVRPGGWQQVHGDCWGAQVTAFEVHEPCAELVVTATSTVEVDRAAAPPPGGSWELLRDRGATDAVAEFLDAGPQPPAGLVRRAWDAAADGGSPDEVAVAVCRLARAAAGSAAHRAPGDAARAVAELALGCLRALGLPARWVSGYRHPRPDVAGEAVVVHPHAWVEWWAGGWRAWDPLLDAAPGDGHVVLARARGRSDVPALRSAHPGPRPPQVLVRVEMTRLP
ncbi:transglutaminase family protein [Quadrisphaera sp. DSM 44207]|uniref:transglutaminase-like domain-containing protein n=1 Tax=Quadrisphaera sp. DSM 44207 TaxID=1881057 RepID=UPI0008862CF0|nr:transglutaminase family protein [Quadrisphaera sp. DSM 44207]SDQ04933.1 Transglutaminase-like enzyme, putative cysteine protease [Quadrisphaera sp. DSM 44207]